MRLTEDLWRPGFGESPKGNIPEFWVVMSRSTVHPRSRDWAPHRQKIQPTSTAPQASIRHGSNQCNPASCEDPTVTMKRRWTRESTMAVVFGSSQTSLCNATTKMRGRRKKSVKVAHLSCGHLLREDSAPTVAPTAAAKLRLWRPPPQAMRTSVGRGLVNDLRGLVVSQQRTKLVMVWSHWQEGPVVQHTQIHPRAPTDLRVPAVSARYKRVESAHELGFGGLTPSDLGPKRCFSFSCLFLFFYIFFSFLFSFKFKSQTWIYMCEVHIKVNCTISNIIITNFLFTYTSISFICIVFPSLSQIPKFPLSLKFQFGY